MNLKLSGNFIFGHFFRLTLGPAFASVVVGVAIAAILAGPAVAADVAANFKEHCASCHGVDRLGGLGPALLPEDLRDKPAEGLAATIYYGRPGTPMPPWKAFMSEAEAAWIVDKLMTRFPE